MQRMRRTQKQKCLYRRTMETRRRGTHLPRVCRNTPRCRGAVSMPRLPVLVPRRRISNTIPSSPMQFLSRVLHLRTTQAMRPMQRKKCATEYTSAAWKARNADRRICRACATKSRGSWTCRTCQQVLPHQSFTAFRRRRPSGQDGTQVCDKCLQATVIKPIAAMAALRLSRSRQRERNKKIWNEVRREIAAMVSARTRAGEAYPEPAPKRTRCEAGRDNEPFSEAAPEPRPATHTSRSKKCLYLSLLQDGGSVDSAKWQGLHSKPLWKAVPCERRPGDQVISACMPPLRRHSCVYKSEGPNPSPAHDAERPAVQNNAMEGVRRKRDMTNDAPPVAKTQRHAAHKKCLTSLSEALKEEVTAPHHPRKLPNVAF